MSALTMPTRLTGKHILLTFIGFFAVVFAVNMVFVYVALSTKPGEERGSGYDVGLRYNTMLEEQRQQDALGWRHQATLGHGALSVIMVGPGETPVTGLALLGVLGRPTTEAADRKLAFREVAPGHYEASVDKVSAGSWILEFDAEKRAPGEQPRHYRAKERLWIAATH